MSLITTTGLGKSYGPVDIFSGIDLTIPPRSRIAIVGPNGVGKTTLLRILVGIEEPSMGHLQRAKKLKFGYLPQEASLPSQGVLWQECLSALSDLLVREAELRRLESEMAEPALAEEALARYGTLQHTFELLGGYTYETRIRQTLTGLGFDEKDFQRPLVQLSGGQRTRALLARLLLENPDLLILDEPTNHLDINAVEWLEGYLSQWEGAALLVSHDRYFLDRVVDHVWEMRSDGLEVYRGNYSAYLQQRQERWELRQQIFLAEKERLEKDLDYIKRNIAGQNTLQAKGRLRRLSRTLDAIDKGGLQSLQGKKWMEISEETGATAQMMSVEEAEQRLHALRNPIPRPPRLSLKLKADLRSGDLVLRTYDLQVGYADEGKPLFRAPDLTLKRGECAALIGPNGAGKTTFLKTILGFMPPLAGETVLGASLKIAYFAQAHEGLKAENTLVQEIETAALHMLEGEIRAYLARFMFFGEDVYKQVSTLSGGERGRLALAKLSLSDANMLLLDEPTNHLDIPSQEILQHVLADYPGTILLVSHDRYLIDALGTQIWEIEPDETSLRIFLGTYSEYRLQKESEKAIADAPAKSKKTVPRHTTERSAPVNRRRIKQLQEIETQIAGFESRLAELSRQLENPPADPGMVQRLGGEYVQVQEKINALMAEWEKLN
ncbi:MAG: ABC-F family ATP-binding cassette domain-containing protein [Anaerolineales bacterium]|nr:ABC-F family ATP-binding cassette domain-containing protein [Anaerolineales bacterium]